jgi:hypothetical protein
VVGLGDAYMSAQNAKGESFMDVYVAEIEKALGRPVGLTLLTSNDATSAKVRESLGERRFLSLRSRERGRHRDLRRGQRQRTNPPRPT